MREGQTQKNEGPEVWGPEGWGGGGGEREERGKRLPRGISVGYQQNLLQFGEGQKASRQM